MPAGAIFQYALVLVLVIFVVFVLWQIWCVFAINVANPVLEGLRTQGIPTRMCGRTADFLHRAEAWARQIRLPEAQPVDIKITSDVIQILIGLGLILVLVLLVAVLNSLLRNLREDLSTLGTTLARLLADVLEGLGILKLIEKLKGKKHPSTVILFLAADPSNATHLRLGEELREIQENLQLGKFRKSFALEVRTAVRPRDLTRALMSLKPKIVHFSGHGTGQGELILEDKYGKALPVPARVLSEIFSQFEDQIQCVVLNACYSDKQAKAIARHIRHVIGASKEIADAAAIEFSVGFYQSLGEGQTIEKSYEIGRQLAAVRDQQAELKLRFLPSQEVTVV